MVEDASWLRPEDASHIILAELDVVIKGVNVALVWKLKTLHVRTDSHCLPLDLGRLEWKGSFAD